MGANTNIRMEEKSDKSIYEEYESEGGMLRCYRDNTFTMYGPNTGDPSSLRGDRTNPNSCGIVTDTSITSGNSVNIRVDTGTSNFIRFDAEL